MVRSVSSYDTRLVLDLSALRMEAERTALCVGLSPERCDDFRLVVSELVTNGLKHGQGPVVVTLTAVGVELSVSVSDSLVVPIPLHCRLVCTDDDNGRGLDIVQAYANSASWGIHDGRKHVRAVFALPRPATAPTHIVVELQSPNARQAAA
jgi:anti-sigma regulatory factor (Ser/Thr protein kinase)